MKKIFIILFAIIGLYFVFQSPKKGKTVAFLGTWSVEEKNYFLNLNGHGEKIVATDGTRFRIDFHNNTPLYYRHSLDVYDGTTLSNKIVVNQSLSALPGENLPTSSNVMQTASPKSLRLNLARFWIVVDKEGFNKEGPGPVIAGRPTVKYRYHRPRKEGVLSGDVWLDAETDIVLKMDVSTLAIRDPNAGVIDTTKKDREVTLAIKMECKNITYGPIADSYFTLPQ